MQGSGSPKGGFWMLLFGTDAGCGGSPAAGRPLIQLAQVNLVGSGVSGSTASTSCGRDRYSSSCSWST